MKKVNKDRKVNKKNIGTGEEEIKNNNKAIEKKENRK